MRTAILPVAFLVVILISGRFIEVGADNTVTAKSTQSSQTALRGTLREALQLPGSIISVHAAESLLLLGDRDDVLARYQSDRAGKASAYQVAAWRVLARAEVNEDARASAVNQIRKTLLDDSSGFRVHAMESLAKLNAPILADESAYVESVAFSETDNGAPFALWRIAQTERREQAISQLTHCLKSSDEVLKIRAAYTLWHLRPLPESTVDALKAIVAQESQPGMAKVVSALASNDSAATELAMQHDAAAARYFLALELADKSDEESLHLLRSLVEDRDLDVRAAAAYALLKRTDSKRSAH